MRNAQETGSTTAENLSEVTDEAAVMAESGKTDEAIRHLYAAAEYLTDRAQEDVLYDMAHTLENNNE